MIGLQYCGGRSLSPIKDRCCLDTMSKQLVTDSDMPSVVASTPNDTSTDNKETSFRHRRASTIEENYVSDDLSVSMQSANAPGAIALGGSNQAGRDAESQVSVTEPTFSLRSPTKSY